MVDTVRGILIFSGLKPRRWGNTSTPGPRPWREIEGSKSVEGYLEKVWI